MPIDQNALMSLIDTPEKARKAKEYLATVDRTTLSPEMRRAYGDTQNFLRERWASPTGDVYQKPRMPGDAISRIGARNVAPPPSQSGDPTGTPDPTLGEHTVAGLRGVADLVGLPTSREEVTRNMQRSIGMPVHMVADLIGSGRDMYKRGVEEDSTFKRVAAFVPMAPPLVTMGENISTPAVKAARGGPATREETLAATRSGASALVGLATVPKSARYANVPGNRILDPARTIAKAEAQAGRTVSKAVDKISRKYDPKVVKNARVLAGEAQLQLEELRAGNRKPAGPPTRAHSYGDDVFGAMDDAPPAPSLQSQARLAITQSDRAIGTAREATRMAKREKIYRQDIPDDINRRLDPFVENLPARLKRGDDVGGVAFDTYKKTGIPDNPQMIQAEKVAQHEATQARLQQPDMDFPIPEEAVINAVAGDALKKMVAPIGDAPTVNPVLRDIVARYKQTGQVNLDDYATLRDMATGNYVVEYNPRTGEPVMGSVPMPQALAETIGYIERLRREHGGQLPRTPLEINKVKAERYQEINDRTFGKEITEADKTLAGIHRGQAAGLRNLVDEVTAGPDGRSPISELNSRYASLAALEEGITNFELAKRTSNPLPPIMMGGNNLNPVKSGLTGIGLSTIIPRSIRNWVKSPDAGRIRGLVREQTAVMRGLQPPPPIRPAQGPAAPPSFDPGAITPARGTVPPAPPPKSAPPSSGRKSGAPAAAGTPDYQALGREAFTYARNGNLKKLEALWKEHGTKLKSTMRKSDVAWVEDKLKRRAEKASAKPTDKVAGPPDRKKQRTEDLARREALVGEVADSVLAEGANKALKEIAATRKAATSPAGPIPGSAAEALGQTTPLETVSRGDWRQVKQAPPPVERTIKPVDPAAMTPDQLTAKITEWTDSRKNAQRMGDRKRAAYYDKLISDATDTLTGIKGEPASEVIAPPAKSETAPTDSILDQFDDFDNVPEEAITPPITKTAKPPKSPKPRVTPGSDPRSEPKVSYQAPSGGLQKFSEHTGVRKGGFVRANGVKTEVLDITGFGDGRVVVKTALGNFSIDKVKAVP